MRNRTARTLQNVPLFAAASGLLVVAMIAGPCWAGLGGRSAGGAGRSMGGAGRSMGGGGRSMGGGMPMSRPQSSVPHLGGANMGRPAPRPQVGRPTPQVGRPGISPPQGNRPSTLPGANLPTQRPAPGRPSTGQPLPGRPTRPNVPSQLPGGITRPGTGLPPTTRPGTGLPPTTRPGTSLPPTNRPGTGTRPSTRPGAVTRPGNLDRPGMPDFGSLPAGRPSSRELGNFLDLDQPIRPGDRPSTLPADRPTTRPGRPGSGLQPRPNINIGNISLGNNRAISVRPTWASIDRSAVNQINNRWRNSIANMPTTLPAYAGRWGNAWRAHWRLHWHGRPPGFYGPSWWANHRFRICGWHYMYRYSAYPVYYWWRTPTFGQFATWFVWTQPVPPRPVYYDYGPGGNVSYVDNSVHISGQPVATQDEFAQTAALLATVDEPEDEEAAKQAEWLPLGTFALMTDETDVDSSRVIQLAVNKEGIVSGTLYNRDTDETQAVQGRVDKETQRVALRIGESEDVIAETGLYNLTQDEASILVHYGTDVRDAYLLVRLPNPEDEETEAQP